MVVKLEGEAAAAAVAAVAVEAVEAVAAVAAVAVAAAAAAGVVHLAHQHALTARTDTAEARPNKAYHFAADAAEGDAAADAGSRENALAALEDYVATACHSSWADWVVGIHSSVGVAEDDNSA